MSHLYCRSDDHAALKTRIMLNDQTMRSLLENAMCPSVSRGFQICTRDYSDKANQIVDKVVLKKRFGSANLQVQQEIFLSIRCQASCDQSLTRSSTSI